ncbi:MAG: DUF4366 domain-containing protein [Christensenellales bacterium]|jgi:hypothetical protein
MKNKKRVRTLAALLAVMLCMTAFSTVAYAGGGDGEPYYTEQSTEIAEPEATPEPQEETGGIEPQPLTPDGNMTLVDDIDGAADKQFITVVTKNGNYFYIIIDRADDGENTVHFLNQVDEADLLALMEDVQAEETPAACTCTEKCEAGAVNTSCPICKNNMSECAGKEAVTVVEPEEKSGGSPLLILLVLLLLGGGGALVYIKLIKPKQSVKGGTDLDELDFDEDDEDSDVYQPEEGDGQEDEE